MSFIDFLTSNFIVGTCVFLLMFTCILSIHSDLKARAEHKRTLRMIRSTMNGER